MSFLHASAPRPVSLDGRTGTRIIESTGAKLAQEPKRKYRDPMKEEEEEGRIYVKPNIMFDPRVQRGTNAGKTAILASTLKAGGELNSTIPRGTSSFAPSSTSSFPSSSPSRPSKSSLLASGAIRPAQPSVEYIHNHITVVKKRVEVPMHLYLIEQSTPTLTHSLPVQTDTFMPEAPTPAYIPRKTGVDMETQVDEEMVFRFDEDVEKILEVVVSKGLEQALMEVREEEEMREIESHRVELVQKYEAEESQATEALRAERALFTAKQSLLASSRLRHQHILSIRSKLSASFFARHYLKDLQENTMGELRKAGFFNAVDSVSHQLEATYMPGLVTAVDLDLSKTVGARRLVQELIDTGIEEEERRVKEVKEERERVRKVKEEGERVKREVEEELERRRKKIQLFIHSSAIPADQSPVGPINLTGESTVSDIESKVYKWMEDHLSPEDLPLRQYLTFLWNGEPLKLDQNTPVYDLGIHNLSTMTMVYDEPKKEEEEKEEEGEEEAGEEEEEEEEEEEDEDDV